MPGLPVRTPPMVYTLGLATHTSSPAPVDGDDDDGDDNVAPPPVVLGPSDPKSIVDCLWSVRAEEGRWGKWSRRSRRRRRVKGEKRSMEEEGSGGGNFGGMFNGHVRGYLSSSSTFVASPPPPPYLTVVAVSSPLD
jgi:hypothetical protein